MTSEKWLQKEFGNKWKNYSFQMDWVSAAKLAWNAAKEDSKPVAKIVERKLHGMNQVEYSIIGYDGYESAIRNTKEAAEKWAIENGYRLE